jgi:hypothetical protein
MMNDIINIRHMHDLQALSLNFLSFATYVVNHTQEQAWTFILIILSVFLLQVSS